MTPVDPKEMLSEARDELARADGKAAMLLAVAGVVFGVIAAAILAGSWSPHELDVGYQVMWWIGGGIAAAGTFELCLAVWPRITHELGSSITYFNDIALLGEVANVKAALEGGSSEERVLVQLVAISGIVRRKFIHIRRAMVLLGAGSVLVLVALIGGR